MNQIIKLDTQSPALYDEKELLCLIMRLVSIFAKLQRANIAHRNIKPANLVFSAPKKSKTKGGAGSPKNEESLSGMKFDDIQVCNFELSTWIVTDLAFNK